MVENVMRKMAGDKAIWPADGYEDSHRMAATVRRKANRKYNANRRATVEICWECPSLGAIYANCHYGNNPEKCPKVRAALGLCKGNKP